MNTWHALILGLVQGVTEFLPISSTGHLALFQQWLNVSEASLFFDVFLHAASVIAIIIFFRKEIGLLTRGDYTLLAVGTLPAIAVGLGLENFLETVLATPLVIGITFLITGVFNFLIHHLLNKPVKEPQKLTPKIAIIMGVFQAVAIIPAISRSGSTLLGGLWQRIEKEKAFTFTFLLAIPAIIGATALQAYRFFNGDVHIASSSWLVYLIGGMGAFMASMWGLTLLRHLLVRSRFHIFGWYCVLLGGGVLIAQWIR